MSWKIERNEQSVDKPFPMLKEMWIERGDREDWDRLHELHYKTDGMLFGPRFFRVMTESSLVGVCVMTYPRGLLRARHKLFPGIKPGGDETKITNVHRYRMLNRDFALNARTVNDTLFRGVGVGYRMLNLAARMDGCKIVEIQSSMSRFNLFAHRAGFRFTKTEEPPLAKEARLAYADWFETDPADVVGLKNELDAMPEWKRNAAMKDMREFYYIHSAMEKTGKYRGKGPGRVMGLPEMEIFKNIAQLCFAAPEYGIYINPDYGRELPERIPLSAFDNQSPEKPLRLDLI